MEEAESNVKDKQGDFDQFVKEVNFRRKLILKDANETQDKFDKNRKKYFENKHNVIKSRNGMNEGVNEANEGMNQANERMNGMNEMNERMKGMRGYSSLLNFVHQL